MNLEKQKAFIIHVIFIAFLLLLVYIGIKYLLPLLMPFVIGMIVAMIFRRLIDLFEKKTRVKRVYVSILVLIVFYGILGYVLSLIGFKTFTFLSDLISSLPGLYKNTLLPALQSVMDDAMKNFPSIRPYLENFMNNIDDSIFKYLSNASSSILTNLAGLAGQVPTLLIKFIFTIVSSFFFTIDYYKISHFIILQFKRERREMLLRMKDNGIGTIGKFLRAYSAIISITFVELSTGFWIIGIPHPILFGILVAIIDVMPILGTGTILLPWSIIAFILGNTKVGIGMLLLYIFITAVRQIIEPKIVGQQIGLHPIVTLILMYVGAQLMGVLGLFMLPLIMTLLLKLNDEGSIHLFKK
ncbi:MAG TPA: sporulation integral membrane protein YtvI [Mobilitalea sp.]|nr:sporulation integral membrane protein YtvI [Mobilitalea sp.]